MVTLEHGQQLAAAYQAYLTAPSQTSTVQSLILALEQCHLVAEAHALKIYLDHGSQVIDHFTPSHWDKHRCFIGASLPMGASKGDIWFDVIELTPMMLMAETIEGQKSRWMALHPAYNWQFRAFLSVVQWHLIQEYFMQVPDLMQPDRILTQDPLAYATKIYHEEAVAYAHWFGKYMSGWFDLRVANAFVDPHTLARMLPARLRVWDEGFYRDEFTRVALSDQDIEIDPGETDDEDLPETVMFQEWAVREDVSLLTAVSPDRGFISNLPRKAYEFVELTNTAPRSGG